MAAYSCDFSYARPVPAAIKAAGYVGVWRYLSGGTPGKDITFAEFESYLNTGLGVGLVWETSAQAALGTEQLKVRSMARLLLLRLPRSVIPMAPLSCATLATSRLRPLRSQRSRPTTTPL